MFVEVGEGVVEVVYGSTENADVIGVTQVGDESSLGRLIFEIATEMSPAYAPSELLFFLAEKMFIHVVCSLDHGDDGAVVIADYRMPKELVPVFVEVLEDGRVRCSRLGEAFIADTST